ncbi:MAG: cysteine desulfurase [Planctomycetes bacterium]|nr:cysteine desulfurase [Planctomycetota bacterium]
MTQIYLDYNASTPIAPEVAEAMQPFLTDYYGNPSTSHWAGVPAKAAVEQARAQVADLLGCQPDEVVFTSGGTESNNHAIKGAFFAQRGRGNHIITTQIEHPAIVQPCHFLETLGAHVTYLPVDRYGRVDPDDVKKAMTDQTILVTVMHANNEIGTVQPISEISCITQARGVLLHTDAAQSVGKIPTKVCDLGVDLLTVAGHKVYGPKGVGVLYVRRGVALEPFMHGAGHETGRRAGTENVLGNVGLGAACEVAQSWIGMPEVCRLRDLFWRRLQETYGDRVRLNGHPTCHLPNTLNVSWIGRQGADLLGQLQGVAASTGSACHEGQMEMSPVLKAMGLAADIGMGAIRFSLGRATTEGHIEKVLALLKQKVRR